MNDSLFRGGCLCGAVRYEIAAPLAAGEYCHCSMCRKAHGSAFSANIVVPTSALSVATGSELIAEYASSQDRLKCFCARCGSHLFILRAGDAHSTVVTLGSLDDDAAIPPPQRHVFLDSKASWHVVDAALPQYRIYPGYEPIED